jgi:hypothetical protein
VSSTTRFRVSRSIETSLSEVFVVAIIAWKTATAVILLFVLCVATLSPAHHDKRGVGHDLFNGRRCDLGDHRAHHAI